MSVLPLESVEAQYNLCLSSIAVIPQVGRRPQPIFDFTWSGMNEATKFLAPMEAMRFGGSIQRILKQVFVANQRLWTVYTRKVDLADTYIYLWVRM